MQIKCRAAMCNWGSLKAWAASWPFASGRPWAWGGGSKKEKCWLQRPHMFVFLSFFLDPTPPPAPVSCLLFTLPPSPLLLPYQETPDCHALPQPHEPPYPPLLIVLIARNLSGCIATSKNIKKVQPTQKWRPHSVPFCNRKYSQCSISYHMTGVFNITGRGG